jgi:hypothetical protein
MRRAQPRRSSLQLARLCSTPLLLAVEHADVARCDLLLRARFGCLCSLRRQSSGSRRQIQASSSRSSPWPAATPTAEAATEARRGSRMEEEQGISSHGASSLPRGAGRRRHRGELGRRSAGYRRVRDMVELRDGGARRRQGRREAGGGTRVVGDGARVRGPHT